MRGGEPHGGTPEDIVFMTMAILRGVKGGGIDPDWIQSAPSRIVNFQYHPECDMSGKNEL
jgi:hypothetical protein